MNPPDQILLKSDGQSERIEPCDNSDGIVEKPNRNTKTGPRISWVNAGNWHGTAGITPIRGISQSQRTFAERQNRKSPTKIVETESNCRNTKSKPLKSNLETHNMDKYLKVYRRDQKDQPVRMFKPGYEPQSFAAVARNHAGHRFWIFHR